MDELTNCWCNNGCPYQTKENDTWQVNMCNHYNINRNTQDLCIVVRMIEFSAIERSDEVQNGELYKLKTYNKDHHLPVETSR